MDYLEMMQKYDDTEIATSTLKDQELVRFFQSEFWTDLVNKTINSLKEKGHWEKDNMQLNYIDLQNKISNLLTSNGFPGLDAMNDGFEPKEEVEILKKFESKLIN